MFKEFKNIYVEVKMFQDNLTALPPDETKGLLEKLGKLYSLGSEIREQSLREIKETNELIKKLQNNYLELTTRLQTILQYTENSDDIYRHIDELDQMSKKITELKHLLKVELNENVNNEGCINNPLFNQEETQNETKAGVPFSDRTIDERISQSNFSALFIMEDGLVNEVFSYLKQQEWFTNDFFLKRSRELNLMKPNVNYESLEKALEGNVTKIDDLEDLQEFEEKYEDEIEEEAEIIDEGSENGLDPIRFSKTITPTIIVDRVEVEKEKALVAILVEAPRMLKEEIQSEILNSLIKGEYARAYWFSFNKDTLLPTWLVKAYFYSNYVNSEQSTKDAVQELYTIVSNQPDPIKELTSPPYNMIEIEVQLLVASIASFTSLVAPSSYINNWLNVREQGFSKIPSILKVIYDFSVHNQPLLHALKDLKQVTSIHELEKNLVQTSKNMEQWLVRMKKLKFNYKPATLVFHHFLSDVHDIGAIIQLINKRETTKYERIQTFVSQSLTNQKTISTLIESTYVKLKDVYIRKIEGNSQAKLIDRLNELKIYFEEYAQTAKRIEEAKKHADWSNTRLTIFRNKYLDLIDVVEVELDDYIYSQKPYPELNLCSTFAKKAKETFVKIKHVLEGEKVDNSIKSIANMENDLVEPLLLLPQFPGDNFDRVPASINQEQSQQILDCYKKGKTLEIAFEQHISIGDFTAANIILESFYYDHENYEQFQTLYHDELIAVEMSFSKECSKIRNLIEQSTIEHVFSESEQSELEAELLSIEESKNKQFSLLYKELTNLEKRVSELRSFRKESLMKHLEEISKRISQINLDHQKAAYNFEKDALACLEKGDIALADEYMNQIEMIITNGPQPDADNMLENDQYFSEFLNCHDKVHGILGNHYKITMNDIKKAELTAVLNMNRVPGSRMKEIENTFLAFNRLKGKVDFETTTQAQVQKDIVKLLEYLGFIRPTMRLEKQDKTFISISAEMTIGDDKSPLPDFGTSRHGNYQLLLLKGRPTAEMIGQYIQTNSIKEKAPIVVFLGRMTMRQRKEWGSYCRKKKLTVLLVDEVLTFYLASMRHLRFRALIECTMPFGYNNPYVPFSAGNVPDEMFMGRQDIVKSIMDPNGIAIIYGGRQLGKSAILRKIERDFVKSSSDYYVFLEDIRNLGSEQSSQSKNEIWTLLRGWFIRMNLLRSNISDNPQVLREEIGMLFEKKSNLRILILLDEADNFLKADAEQDFEIIYKLKQIMDETNRRFKVIFSGLHGVQRFTYMSNHPFAHLDTINIRPLEGKAAKALIKEPLVLIGYQIEDNALYRILAYTNYHPAIIQHFCRELVIYEIATRKYGFKDPLYKIDMTSVEAVYRKHDVRKKMYERYEWTVALDEKYEVLVYAMIYDQMKERDGYRKQYNYKNILEMAKDWWEEGFKKLTLEQGRSLLDELIGLGVLVKVEEYGSYRIKNANIVRALGTPDEIKSRLERFIDKPASKEFTQQSVHRRLDTKANIWSPLTIAQEGYLLNKQSGMSLIFASEALGYEYLKTALKELGTKKQNNLVVQFLELPPEYLSYRLIHSYFEKKLTKYKTGRIIFYIRATQLFNCSDGILKILEELQSQFAKHKLNRNRTIQYWITFNSVETGQWCQLPSDKRTKIEDESNATIICEPWDKEMIQRVNKAYKMMDIVPVNEAMFHATNGWPILLYDFLNQIELNQADGWDPRSLLETFKLEMIENGSLYTSIQKKLGYRDVPFALKILKVIQIFPDVGEYELIKYLEDDLNQTEEDLLASFEVLKRLGIVRIINENFNIDMTVQELVFLE